MEGFFALVYRLFPHPFAMRGLAILASLGASAFLLSALHGAGLDERRAIIFAWSPLAALEFGNSAHLDALAILFLCAAFSMAA